MKNQITFTSAITILIASIALLTGCTEIPTVTLLDRFPSSWSNVIEGNRAYIADETAISIYDITEGQELKLLSTTITGKGKLSICVKDGFLYSGCKSNQLMVYDARDPLHVVAIDSFSIGLGFYEKLVIANNHLYVGINPYGTWIFRIDSLGKPNLQSKLARAQDKRHRSRVSGIACDGTTLVIADEYGYYNIYDVKDPKNPQLLASRYQTTDGPYQAKLVGDILYFLIFQKSLVSIDISDRTTPKHLYELPLESPSYWIAIKNNRCYVTTGEDRMLVTVDIADPGQLKFFDRQFIPEGGGHVAVTDNRLLVGLWSSGLKLYDISSPTGIPELQNSIPFRGYPNSLSVVADTLVVPSGNDLNLYPIANSTSPDQWKKGMVVRQLPGFKYGHIAERNGTKWFIADSSKTTFLVSEKDGIVKKYPSARSGNILVDGNHLYIVGDTLDVFDVSGTDPVFVGTLSLPPHRSWMARIAEGKLAIREDTQKGKILLYDIGDQQTMKRMGEIESAGLLPINSFWLTSTRLFVSSDRLITYDISKLPIIKKIDDTRVWGGAVQSLYANDHYLIGHSYLEQIVVFDIRSGKPKELTWIKNSTLVSGCSVVNDNLLVLSYANLSYFPLKQLQPMWKPEMWFLKAKFWVDGVRDYVRWQ